MNKKKGFTLIELLVVIAIIGLLSSIILVSLQNTRNRAKDAKIQADLHQIRNAAAIYYSNQIPLSYLNLNLACNNDPNIKKLCDDISAQSTGNPTIVVGTTVNPGTAYCVYKQLISTKWACVDSAGNAEFNLAAAPSVTCVSTAAATCK